MREVIGDSPTCGKMGTPDMASASRRTGHSTSTRPKTPVQTHDAHVHRTAPARRASSDRRAAHSLECKPSAHMVDASDHRHLTRHAAKRNQCTDTTDGSARMLPSHTPQSVEARQSRQVVGMAGLRLLRVIAHTQSLYCAAAAASSGAASAPCCLDWKSLIAILTASSASIEQCSFTGGNFRCFAMS